MKADPAEVIAGALIKPPPWPDRPPGPSPGGIPFPSSPELLHQHIAGMFMVGGPALARHLAAGIVEALTSAGLVIVPVAGTLPTVGQVRRWLLTHGWLPAGNGGTAGTLWTPPGGGRRVGVPYDNDPELIPAAIRRVAERHGYRDPGGLTREMLACDDAG